MGIREPRKNPVPGDVLTRFGTTRKVTNLKRNDRGTVTHVLYCHPTTDTTVKEATISSWRAWAKMDAIVVWEGTA